MISYKNIKDMNNIDVIQCNNLINNSFKNNRFEKYENAVIYTKNKEIIAFVGIYDNLLNQLCTSYEYRKQGIATKIINMCKKYMSAPIYLYIDKHNENTEMLLNFYIKNSFYIDIENEIEYKMIYK